MGGVVTDRGMAHSSSDDSRMNKQSPHPADDEAEAEDEAWKTRPSTETTSDEGVNARVERERKILENAPRLDDKHR